MKSVIPKSELLRIVKKFLQDRGRGISMALFAELCGVSSRTLHDVFLVESEELSEYIQRRVSKGYQSWLNGQVGVYQNRDTTRFIEYRKQPKPMLRRNYGLKVVDGKIKVDVGVKNRADYSGFTLEEQLERG